MNLKIAAEKKGAAIVAFMLVTVIILGSMLTLHTAAVITIGGTSRALEIARQNAATALRLERATREAAQSFYGTSVSRCERGFSEELAMILGSAPLGDLELTSLEITGQPEVPRMFPHLAGAPSVLTNRSSELDLLCTPSLMAFTGSRVAESSTFDVRYTFTRQAVKSIQTYSLGVKCRLVAVPISRFGLMPYDLPEEIGKTAALGTVSGSASTEAVGPRGLVPNRDSADVPGLSTGSKRPGYFRFAAALSESYQYIFSGGYLETATDYAGATHFVQIGAGTANPVLRGGSETGTTYSLDIGEFGEGTLGPKVATKDVAIFYATSDGCTLVLTDSGANASPILLLVAGPARGAAGPLTLQFGSALRRPIVLVCYHTQLSAPPDSNINGALLLDRDCTVPLSVGPIALGHVSYWGGSAISPSTFRVGSLPQSVENLVPRTLYVATARTFL